MVYAIAAIVGCVIGGFIWLGYKAYGAGKSTEQTNVLKAGSEARERQNESFDKNRRGLAERIGIRLRDNDKRDT